MTKQNLFFATGVVLAAACSNHMTMDMLPDGAVPPDALTTTSITAATHFNFTTFDGPGGAPTTVNGINTDGAAVGFTTSQDAMGNDVNANFIRNPDGTFTALTLGDPGASANGLDATGDVVGVANDSAFAIPSTIGTLEVLQPLAATASVAFSVNNSGVIVGQYTKDTNTMPGFIDIHGAYTAINPTAAATMTFVAGINSAGLAIGFYSEDGTTQHGFTYDQTTQQISLLPDPSTPRITATNTLVLTQFLSIDDADQAAGYYQTADGSQYGFVYDLATKAYIFLDDPMAAPVAGVQITQITGINSARELAGFFIDAAGAQHGFVAAATD